MGNNPEKQVIYRSVLSLFISRMIRMVNKKEKLPCSLVFDEFPTIFFNHMDSVIATARSNKVATTLAMQDFSQLKKDYGRDQAEVIMNITGNVISGQVSGETAKQLSERFGKIMQDRESISITRTDTNISKSKQLDYAIPSSKIASLSSGEFVGMIADNPDQKIKLKMFHSEVIQPETNGNNVALTNIPNIKILSSQMVADNYMQIKLDIQNMLTNEIERLKKELNI